MIEMSVIEEQVKRNCILDFELKMLKLMSEDGDFFVSTYGIIDGNKLNCPFCRRAHSVLRDVYESTGNPLEGGVAALKERMCVMDRIESSAHYEDEAEYTFAYLEYMDSLVIKDKQAIEIKKSTKYLFAYRYILELRATLNNNATKPIADMDWNYWKKSVGNILDEMGKLKDIYDELTSIERGERVERKVKDDWD